MQAEPCRGAGQPACAKAVADLADALVQRGTMLAVAESCTGGLLAGMLTAQAGSSAWFAGGVISYSNACKQALLGVRASTLANFGAVSEPTAIEMAEGVLLHIPEATLSLSITGIAGPDGGLPNKPVGTVCFGLGVRRAATRPLVVQAATRQFRYDNGAADGRAAIRYAALRFSLECLSVDAGLPFRF